MTYLDAPGGLQRTAAAGALLAGLGEGDVGEDVHLEVAGVVGPGHVGVGLVGADDEVVATLDGGVGYLANAGNAHRRRAARHQPGCLHLCVLGESEVVAVQGVLQLDLVDFEVAANDDEHRLPVCHVEDGLEGPGFRHAQELGQARDSLDAGGSDLPERFLYFNYGDALTPTLSLGERGYGGDDRFGLSALAT